MQKTEGYGLNLFEKTDPVLAEHFNENTQTLETEIQKAQAQQSQITENKNQISLVQTTLTQQVSSLQATDQTLTGQVNTITAKLQKKSEIISGSYTGDGTETRTLQFEKAPMLVILVCDDDGIGFCTRGWKYTMTFCRVSITSVATSSVVTNAAWSNDNKTLTVDGNSFNVNGKAHHYFAFFSE